MRFTVPLLQSKFAYCKICKEPSVASLLYSAVLKSEMKIWQKYGKNIKVKDKTERSIAKGRGIDYARKKRHVSIKKYERERMRRFWRLLG